MKLRTQKEQEAPDRLLTPTEVCERLGVTRRGLDRLISEGRIERIKLGERRNRFRESYINGLVENGLPDEG